MNKLFYGSCLLLAICHGKTLQAQSWQDTALKVQQIFSRYKPGMPGCQFVISRHGQVIFSQAWGMADLEHNAPLTTQSPIEIGSVSKQFTAACILLLEQQGKLSQDDDVRKYIPELPDYGTPITLRSMIYHLSGLKDWEAIVGLADQPVGRRVWDNDDVLDIMCRQQSLNNKPGEEYLYSNSNYNLLAVVVKRVSGMDLANFSRKYIFEPAGMTHTRWRNNFREVVPGRAMAYYYNDDHYFTYMPFENAYGNGGLLTTAEDLAAWNNYYWSGKLGNPLLLPKQLEPGRLNNGDTTVFAAGFDHDTYKGWEKIGMGGNTAGYGCGLVYLPEFGLSFSFITNTAQNMGSPMDEVMDFFVKEKPGSTQAGAPEYKAATAPSAILKTYTGWYSNSRTGDALQLVLKDGKLSASNAGFRIAPQGPLININDHTFYIPYWGKVLMLPHKRLLLIGVGRDTVAYIAAGEPFLTPQTLQKYAGEYHSDEAQVTFIVVVKGNELVLQRTPHDAESLVPTYKDGFYYSGGSVCFERDKSGKIRGMKISLPRARNIAFKHLANEIGLSRPEKAK